MKAFAWPAVPVPELAWNCLVIVCERTFFLDSAHNVGGSGTVLRKSVPLNLCFEANREEVHSVEAHFEFLISAELTPTSMGWPLILLDVCLSLRRERLHVVHRDAVTYIYQFEGSNIYPGVMSDE